MEVPHFITEENARVGGDDSGAPKIYQRLGESNHVVFPVDHAEMRGLPVSGLVEIASRCDGNCGVQMNQLAAFCRVGLGEELLDGNLYEVRITHITIPIGDG